MCTDATTTLLSERRRTERATPAAHTLAFRASTVEPKSSMARPLSSEWATSARARCPLERAAYGRSQTGSELSPTAPSRSVASFAWSSLNDDDEEEDEEEGDEEGVVVVGPSGALAAAAAAAAAA